MWEVIGVSLLLSLGLIVRLRHWRKKANAVIAVEAQLRLLTDALPVLISYVDRDLTYRFINAAYEKWFARPKSEIVGHAMQEVLGSRAVESLEPYLKRVLSGETVNFDTAAPYDSGTRAIAATYVPDKDQHHRVRGFYVLVEDISVRKKAEEALKKSELALEAKVAERTAQLAERESQLDLALRSSSTGAWQWSMADGQLIWDSRMHQIFGTNADSFVATYHGFLALIIPEDRERVVRKVAEAVATDADFDEEYTVAWPDGSLHIVHARGRSYRAETNKMHGVCWDVTARRKAEEEASAYARRFRTVFDSAPDGMLIVDFSGYIDCANRQAEKIFGYGSGELKGKSIEDLVPMELRARPTVLREEYTKTAAVHPMGATRDLMGLRRDGTLFPVAISLSPASEGGFTVAAIQDITLRKEAEERARNALAEKVTESNVRLQQFTSIASHDLRAPARIVGQLLKLLARDYSGTLDARAKEYLELAESEAKKLQAMVDDLFEYTKISYLGFEPKPVSLAKIMRDTLAILATEIAEKRADITYELLPTISGCEIQLRRLFTNLVSNAMKYSRKTPKIRVSAFRTTDEYILSFSDNGVGIEETERERIFDMFYRGSGKQGASGSGIGLASCKKVVENHHGRIWVTSEPGLGSSFHVAFPSRAISETVDISRSALADLDRVEKRVTIH